MTDEEKAMEDAKRLMAQMLATPPRSKSKNKTTDKPKTSGKKY